MGLADKNFLELYIMSFSIILTNKIGVICNAESNEILYMTESFININKGKYELGNKLYDLTTNKIFIIQEKQIISPLTGKILSIEYEYKIEGLSSAKTGEVSLNGYKPLIWLNSNNNIITSNKANTNTLYHIKSTDNDYVLFTENTNAEEITEVDSFTEINAAKLVAEILNFANFQKNYSVDQILVLEPIKNLNKNDINYTLLYLNTFITVDNYNFAIKFQPTLNKLPITNGLINPHTGNIVGRFVNLTK